RLDLGWMVRVVVDDADSGGGAVLLEPPACAAGVPQDRAGPFARHTSQLQRCECGGRIPPIVLAGNMELALERLQLIGPHHRRASRQPAGREAAAAGPAPQP